MFTKRMSNKSTITAKLKRLTSSAHLYVIVVFYTALKYCVIPYNKVSVRISYRLFLDVLGTSANLFLIKCLLSLQIIMIINKINTLNSGKRTIILILITAVQNCFFVSCMMRRFLRAYLCSVCSTFKDRKFHIESKITHNKSSQNAFCFYRQTILTTCFLLTTKDKQTLLLNILRYSHSG